jgi:phosphoglycolate phosphatase-like HAD superfamily hydrolase
MPFNIRAYLKAHTSDIKVVVFDFDGVLVNSEHLKENSWQTMFDSSELTQVALRDAQRMYGSGRGDRYDIVRHVLEHSQVPASEIPLQVQNILHRYNEVVQSGIKHMGLSEDARTSIRIMKEDFPLYINSATPQIDVRQSAENLQILGFFKDILGRPRTKVENLEIIVNAEMVACDNVLFIGDSSNDAKAAGEFGCHFIGYSNTWNRWGNEAFPATDSLTHIAHILCEDR